MTWHWEKLSDIIEGGTMSDYTGSVEDDLRRIVHFNPVAESALVGLRLATDAARRAIHVLTEQERQIKVLREERTALRAEHVRKGTVTAVLTTEDAEELRLYLKDNDMLEPPVNDDPSPAWKRIDAALNTALGDPDSDWGGDDPYRPTMGGGPSEHDIREAQKLK